MSTLRVTNVQDTAGANSATTAQIYNGIAKAWINFNGTGTISTRADFNVATLTDNGVGDYTITFDTAMSDTNYSVSITCTAQDPVLNDYRDQRGYGHPRIYSTSNIRIRTGYDAFYTDQLYINVSIFR
jgi:hypothetical protein